MLKRDRIVSLEKRIAELESCILHTEKKPNNDPVPIRLEGDVTNLQLSKDRAFYRLYPTDPDEIANKSYVDAVGKNGSTGDFTIDGDLTVQGNKITFGNGEIIHNNSDDVINIATLALQIQNDDGVASSILVSGIDEDSRINFMEGVNVKWTMGNDADDSDKFKIDATNILVGGNTKLTLDTSGNLTTGGNITDGSGNTLGSGGASALNDLSDVTYSSGDLTISSLDKIIADDFVVDSGASIELDSHNGNFVAKKAGTEFSSANSAYAGMILGYTYLHPTTTLKSFEIQNSITVEDDVHKITFKTPPSEKVEIEATALINCSSTDTRITVGLSTANATDGYSAVAGQFEYDSTGIFFTDDEIDDQVVVFKFVVESAYLASIGSDNTFWIGFGTANTTKTAYLQYGYRNTHGIGNHPFIIKATALPATIYDGT